MGIGVRISLLETCKIHNRGEGRRLIGLPMPQDRYYHPHSGAGKLLHLVPYSFFKIKVFYYSTILPIHSSRVAVTETICGLQNLDYLLVGSLQKCVPNCYRWFLRDSNSTPFSFKHMDDSAISRRET